MLGAALILSFTCSTQLLAIQSFTFMLYISLGFFVASIPLLCISILFEQWQSIYKRYDYLQRRHKFGLILIYIEVLGGGLSLTGSALLFLNIHVVIGSVFVTSTFLAGAIYRQWRSSVSFVE